MAKEKKEKKEKDPDKPKSPLIWIVLAVVLAVVGSVGGAFIATKMIAKPAEPKVVVAEPTRVSGEEVLVEMDEFLVNLAKNGNSDPQYIRVKLSLLTENEKSGEELTKNIAVARDSVVNVLRQKKADEILNAADSVTNLKKQLQETINNEYGSDIVKEVFVTDLVIQ